LCKANSARSALSRRHRLAYGPRHMGAAARAREESGTAMRPCDQEDWDAARAHASAALGETEFNRIFAESRG